MRALFLAIFLGRPPDLHSLRLDKQGDVLDLDDVFPDVDKATAFRVEESWGSEEDADWQLDGGTDSDSCELEGNDRPPLEDYLISKYEHCTMNRTNGSSNVTNVSFLPHASTEQLKSRFSRPELVYSPYLTALPLFYISQGGTRESCFSAFLGNFSPRVERVDAVLIGDNFTHQLHPLVEDATSLIANYRFWKNHSGIREWRKRWGCLLSHLEVIRMAYEKGMTAAIVLEDDAVPLYSAWHSPIEDLLVTLPTKWEAVQLQWTSDPNVTFFNKSGDGRWYTGGSAWGSAAYVIHRRGMQRLMKVLYNETTRKFKLRTLATRCHKISADDCLLGFSSSDARHWYALGGWWYPEMNSTSGAWRSTRPLQAVARALPPRFLHDSKTSKLHERNQCLDIEIAGNVSSNFIVPSAKAKDGVLLFFPVGVSKSSKAQTTLKMSLQLAKSKGHDVFLAFDEEAIPHRGGEASARKLQLLQHYWQTFGPQWSEKYAYIWALDEDVNLTRSPVPDMALQAELTGAVVVSPAMQDRSYRKELPARKFVDHHRCQYRFTNYVEMLAPMMAPAAWAHLFDELGVNSSFEGVDQIWCNFMQRSGLWQNQTQSADSSACAILDRLTVLHNDDEEDPLIGSVLKAKVQNMASIVDRYPNLRVDTATSGGKALKGTCVS